MYLETLRSPVGLGVPQEGMGKVLAAAGWGGRGEGEGQECPAGDVQCVVVRFGGAASPGGARKAPAPRAVGRMGSQPPEPQGQLGARWEPQGSWLPCRSPAGEWGGGFALFLDPSNGST